MKFNYYFTAILILLVSTNISIAQVGIGTTTPDPSSILEVSSTNQGFLMPRIALTSTADTATITGAEATGLLIYNTATIADVIPGFYYWDGTVWVPLRASFPSSWLTAGNAGTTPGIGNDYIGTSDNQNLVIGTNATEVLRITTPDASSDIQVIAGNAGNNGTEQSPLYTFSNDTNTGIWSDGGDEFSLGGGGQEFITIDEGPDEVIINEDGDQINFRIESDIDNDLFFADGANNSIYVSAASPFPALDIFTSRPIAGLYPVNGYASGQGNTGIYGRHETTATGGNFNAGGAFDGNATGYSTQPGWNVGVVGSGNQAGVYGTTTIDVGDRQGGFFQSQDALGAVQSSASVAGFTSIGNDYYGGYFDGNQAFGDYAYVGIRIGATNYKINGGGSVSTTVKDQEGENRILFAPEAPEILFQDYGVGKLINGEAYINIDPVLAHNIHVDAENPLKVFIQLEGDCNGVYVTSKSKNGFKVKELQNGNSNVNFSWQIVATRADEFRPNGELDSKHVGVRFPVGPGKMQPKQMGVAGKIDKQRK